MSPGPRRTQKPRQLADVFDDGTDVCVRVCVGMSVHIHKQHSNTVGVYAIGIGVFGKSQTDILPSTVVHVRFQDKSLHSLARGLWDRHKDRIPHPRLGHILPTYPLLINTTRAHIWLVAPTQPYTVCAQVATSFIITPPRRFWGVGVGGVSQRFVASAPLDILPFSLASTPQRVLGACSTLVLVGRHRTRQAKP